MYAYLTAAAVAVLVAIGGGLATDTGQWYRTLNKPSWNPPDWLFGPAWTCIYILCVWSAGLLWHACDTRLDAVISLALWLVNAALNLAWSFLFFRWHKLKWAAYESMAMWLSIALLMVWTAEFNTLAAALLLPYLIWVSFATVLNLAIVKANPEYS